MLNNMISNKLSMIVNVIKKNGNEFVCRNDYQEIRAKKAVSCLIQPQCGDKVIIVYDEYESYIVAILDSNCSQTIEMDKVKFNVNELEIESKKMTLNIYSIYSKINYLKSTIRSINIFSLISKFTSNRIKIISERKEDLATERINSYQNLFTKISSIEKKESNIVKENINIEHKNLNSSFTMASGQIKIDAENINLG